MVVLTKIYTKTGDDGTTALGDGLRVSKTHPRIAAYGTVDETNAAVGLAHLLLEDGHADVREMLARIQNDLFDLGADLCVPDSFPSRSSMTPTLSRKKDAPPLSSKPLNLKA